MALLRLTFAHPHEWLSALPPKRWDRKLKKYFFPPTKPPAIAREYLGYLLGRLDAHALRLLRAEWDPWENPDELLASLTTDLVNHAVAAGSRVAVTFTPGKALPRHVIAGELSLEWLHHRAGMAARFALEHFDPVEAQRRHDRAVAMGKKSKRPKVFTVAALPPGSIKAQAEALGCSRRTVARLRRDLRESS